MTLKDRIQALQQELDRETDFIVRLDISSEIHKLKMELEGIEPSNGEIECFGCGS